MQLIPLLWLAALGVPAAPAVPVREASLYENVVRTLSQRYFDEAVREKLLPAVAERYRARAAAAETLRAQREVTTEMLSNVPATHMGLLSRSSFERMVGELRGELQWTFGFELVEHDGKYFAHSVLEGGPAERAGLRRGDRVVLLDGALPAESARLDWRTDDAYLADPPTYGLICDRDDRLELLIEPGWGEFAELSVPAEKYSPMEAARASVRVVEHDGLRIGHIHFWMIHMVGVDALLLDTLEGPLAECDAVVIDLRGRGGNGAIIQRFVDILAGRQSEWNKPVVGLINGYARSAKEVISYELRHQNVATLVGERTAGAVIPAAFADVGFDTYLMFPSTKLNRYTDLLEGVGVEPHVVVQDAGPYSHGADPVYDAGVEQAARLAGARRAAAAP